MSVEKRRECHALPGYPRAVLRTRLLLVLPTLALASSGCGGGAKGSATAPQDDQALVRATLMRFAQATGRHDYAELCRSVFAPVLLQKLAPVNVPCEQATERFLSPVRDPKVGVERVQLDPGRRSALAFVHTSAAGQAPAADVVRLVKEPDGWRISNLGDGPAAPSTPPGQQQAPKPPPPGTPND